MIGDITDMVLSDVGKYNPLKFTTCKVHYDGSIGGNPFDYEIDPKQAVLLSKRQDLNNYELKASELEIFAGIPDVLKHQGAPSSYAQSSRYSLLGFKDN